MNLYFVYSATMWDRSVGTVLTHENNYSEEEFTEIIKGISNEIGNSDYEIVKRLIYDLGFKRPDMVQINTENLK